MKNRNDDGVVAIEYVLFAGFVATGIAIAFATGMWADMVGKLSGLF